MKLYDRIIAGVVWLRKFTIFSPNNFQDEIVNNENMLQWGNFSIGYNMYPNLFNIFIKYSPTATSLIKKKIEWMVGNVPQDIKTIRTTYEASYTNTVDNLLLNIAKDYIAFNGSFAIWVGYDKEGRIDEFKGISLESLRYINRDTDKYKASNDRCMIAILNDDNEPEDIFYQYNPDRVLEQMIEAQEEDQEEDQDNKFKGQILIYNTANDQDYPDCIFNSLVPVLIADGGNDTMVMSILGNADICKTYKKKQGATGTDTANSVVSMGLNSVWGIDGEGGLNQTIAQFGTDFASTGVKSAGETEYLDIITDEPVNNYVHVSDFPKFIDEITKIDERNARRLCMAVGIPYEFAYKMDSGILNQENRSTMITELNGILENDRKIIERIINNILEHSIFEWRISILAIGEGQEDTKKASENIIN